MMNRVSTIYLYHLNRLAEALPKNPAMRFWGLADPATMPSGARVDFFYRPTYIATAFMMRAALDYPSLMNEATFLDSDLNFAVDTVKGLLAACMLACNVRGFDGAGVIRIIDCINIFKDAGADEFLKLYPDLCPEFTKLYQEKQAFVESGEIGICDAWYN